MSAQAVSTLDLPVDLNTATVGDLCERVPGVGAALAARIVEYREECGPFLRLSDLALVPGIGERLAGKLARHLTIGRSTNPQFLGLRVQSDDSRSGEARQDKGNTIIGMPFASSPAPPTEPAPSVQTVDDLLANDRRRPSTAPDGPASVRPSQTGQGWTIFSIAPPRSDVDRSGTTRPSAVTVPSSSEDPPGAGLAHEPYPREASLVHEAPVDPPRPENSDRESNEVETATPEQQDDPEIAPARGRRALPWALVATFLFGVTAAGVADLVWLNGRRMAAERAVAEVRQGMQTVKVQQQATDQRVAQLSESVAGTRERAEKRLEKLEEAADKQDKKTQQEQSHVAKMARELVSIRDAIARTQKRIDSRVDQLEEGLIVERIAAMPGKRNPTPPAAAQTSRADAHR